MTKLFIPYIMGNKSFIKNMKILDENGRYNRNWCTIL